MAEEPLSRAERLAAVELVVQELARRVDWSNAPTAVTEKRLGALLPLSEVADRDRLLNRVRMRMYALIGYKPGRDS